MNAKQKKEMELAAQTATATATVDLPASQVVAELKASQVAEVVQPEAVEASFKFRNLVIQNKALEKLAADGQSATGLVKAAYAKAGFPFAETLLEAQSDGVTTLNKAAATAKKLVKDHGLSAKVANTWLAYKQVEMALRFARNIGAL